VTLLRSAVFFVWFAALSTAMSVLFLPVLILPRKATVWMARRWCSLTLLGLRAIAGLGLEVRGTKPGSGVLVAAKHMSMWDTMALYLLLDDPAVILKRGLLRIPFYGWFAMKAGSIAIDRDGGASTLRKMAQKTREVLAQGRSVLIFPEGTRKKVGAPPDYKPGVAGLYGQLDAACVPVALNSGLYWTGPAGFIKKKGTVVLEFLEPIAPGMRAREFLKLLEERIETATARLVAEGRAALQRTEA